MIRLVVRDFTPEVQDLLKFSADTAEADFLFGEEIPKYINELFNHAMSLNTARHKYRDFTHRFPRVMTIRKELTWQNADKSGKIRKQDANKNRRNFCNHFFKLA